MRLPHSPHWLNLLTALALLAPTAPVRAADDAHDPDDRLPRSLDGVHFLMVGDGANAPATKPDGKWDVSDPPGPHHDATLDTRTGTWMSVDISPDGKTIVFDMLGDLYSIPASGGEAKALTHGLPWDEQPRFSPDGKHIAFTSDRAGGDNIWVMDADGSHPRQVTHENYRLLNSPTWTPDGQYIAARKHYTSTRSAGAGEIWLYHWSGSDGIQMTKRRTDQKDEGEPAFSPDGRYLYWSMDATPGPSFEYNKDGNTQIYVIRRLDRESGDITQVLGGPGGAIRPTPSPDGKSLAFIRRVRGTSVLYVQDIASGAERPVYGHLDRDLQEVWAVHGVYPQIAWTRDSKSLVLWASGGIHKLDVATRALTDIPFHVRDTRRVTEAVRFPVAVRPDSADAKLLRWVTVSPQGDRVVYSALGHLYVKALPNGTPKRLTAQDDVYEFYPSWSRDGRSIVYVTWNDDALGSVRVVASTGGAGRAITSRPGDYVEPCFSPDGATVVYRATQLGQLFSPRYSSEPGLYRIAASGGTPRKLTGDGTAPHFGAKNDRVFFIRTAGADDDDRTLCSVDMDGTEVHTHLKGVYFTEARLSPDERWIAFREKYKVWVTPFTRAGRTADLGPNGNLGPVKLLAKDTGDFLSWSGDSRSLHWSLGATLYTRSLQDLFTFAPGAPDSLPNTPAKQTPIGFRYAVDKARGTIALVGARLVTMKGDEVIEDGTIVETDGRITAIGPRASVTVPAGAQVFDVKGKTITPGFVDVHWHGGMGSEQLIPQRSWIDYASLAFGVTTLHDPSNDSHEIFTQGEMQRAGMIVAPHIFSTGTILYGAKGDFHADVDSLGDALMHLRRMQAYGANSVKSYNQPRREQRQEVLEAARLLHMNVVPEGGALFPHNMTMVIDGHTGVEHALPIGRVYDDVVQLWSQTKVGYTPTYNVAYGGLDGEHYWYAKTQVWNDPLLTKYVPRRILDARARRPVTAPDDEWNHITVAQEANKLHQAGVSIQLGAHGQREGLGAHWDLWSMVQGGMTPHEALKCATLGGAKYLGYDGDIGSLEPGKLADLIIMDKNPLLDIQDSHSLSRVMLSGRLYDCATMNEIAPRSKPRGAFWWEAEQKQLEDVRK